MRRAMKWSLLALSGFVAACSSTLVAEQPPLGMGRQITVNASGVAVGTFPAYLLVVYDLPSAYGFTTVSLLTGKDPGLGINSFAYHAAFVGEPGVRHYDEDEAQITSSVVFEDGRQYVSNVNSDNRLDIAGISSDTLQPDSSDVFQIGGTAAGSADSSESGDAFYFTATF